MGGSEDPPWLCLEGKMMVPHHSGISGHCPTPATQELWLSGRTPRPIPPSEPPSVKCGKLQQVRTTSTSSEKMKENILLQCIWAFPLDKRLFRIQSSPHANNLGIWKRPWSLAGYLRSEMSLRGRWSENKTRAPGTALPKHLSPPSP